MAYRLSAVTDINTPNNVSPRAGEYVGLRNGNSFHSVCVDVEHYLSFGNSYSNDTAKTPAAYGLSAGQESSLNNLQTRFAQQQRQGRCLSDRRLGSSQ
ncbi:MAG: hypothetical protein L6Q60_01930 [Rhodocyclaceae bacterium]|nr:hypothetical protein [Rhodocyclaceae bacterium]